MTRYAMLFSEGRLGSLRLRNRILLTAMGVNFGDGQGYVGDDMRIFCENVARGGAAMVNLGVVGVGWPVGGNIPRQIALSDDRFIPGIRAVAEAVHSHGAKLAVQLHFGGLVATEDMLKGNAAWTPSVPMPRGGNMLEAFLPDELAEAPFARLNPRYKVLDRQDIGELVGMFVAAAERAVRAGADGLEIHGGHGYLISSFLSPVSNQRDDEYGGSRENRARLLTQIVAGIRGRIGRQFPLWCKIDSQEFELEGGISIDDAKVTARMAEEAGVDAITVTAYHDAGIGALHSGSHTPEVPGLLLGNAAAIRAAVGIPVIAAGRIEPEVAEQELRAGRCDFVAMGRKLLADPQL
ncbi:MAG: NADH:flavin oxidoreductase, partial [Proteobacteria bacterium]|nr:NADH:flavin oxidoreductase [Pseudomonadota bacterium]